MKIDIPEYNKNTGLQLCWGDGYMIKVASENNKVVISAEGYKPGEGNNHVLYDVPGQVVNGYIEFQVKGFAHSLVPAGSENGFAGLFAL